MVDGSDGGGDDVDKKTKSFLSDGTLENVDGSGGGGGGEDC